MLDAGCRMLDVRRGAHAHLHRRSHGRHRTSGFTLIEILIAVAIAAVLSLAVAGALSASLMAYGASTESASMSMSGRLTMQKVLTMVRTSSLHDAYDPNDGAVTLLQPGDTNHPLRSPGIAMVLPDGNEVRVWWQVNPTYSNPFMGDMWFEQVGSTAQLVARRVTVQDDGNGNAYLFTLASRTSDAGLLLERATLDFQLERDDQQTTELEDAGTSVGSLRLVGSAVPRKHMD